MKKSKKLILELVILITIAVSVFVVYYVYNEINSITPEESKSNEIVNYSENKYVKITKTINDITDYEIPEKDFIPENTGMYDYYITATDNIINTITEKIVIYYNMGPDLETGAVINKDNVTNFCNSFNVVDSNYVLKCNFQGNTLTIDNIYYLSKIYTDTLKTKNFEWKLPTKKDSKLDEYLESLDKNNIKYTIVPGIN